MKKGYTFFTLFLLAVCCSVLSCNNGVQKKTTAPLALKDAFTGKFYVGVAINRKQATGQDIKGQQLIKQQFNSLSPENDLKWQNIHPERSRYAFDAADAYVKLGTDSGMFIIGHTLVWHSQTPDWVFEDAQGKPLTRDALLKVMQQHIATVVGRYKGRIKGWDVVNEALNDDGTMRDSKWRSIIGDDFIEKAFEFAHAADPDAELYYNDYNLYKPEKRAGAIAIINRIKAKGIPVAAVGEQAHYGLVYPALAEVERVLTDFIKAGIDVNFTELDISVLPDAQGVDGADVSNAVRYDDKLNPYTDGLPDKVQQELAKRYGSLFALFMKYQDNVGRVTFWGLTDEDSWLNNWPVRGRTNYPLLFDRNYEIKVPVQQEILGVTR